MLLWCKHRAMNHCSSIYKHCPAFPHHSTQPATNTHCLVKLLLAKNKANDTIDTLVTHCLVLHMKR